jgi:glyceraldehyde 3-phosphate dehydrogenase
MTIRIAISGYGRIGRNVTRALYESGLRDQVELVAINDLGDIETNAHLTRYDSVHGPFQGEVSVEGGDLVINGDRIRFYSERDPSNLPWGDLDIDVVFEATGHFATADKAVVHLNSGAKKVLISAPAGSDVPTIVYGVNHHTLKASDHIVSNASCTTNCLAPVVKVLHEQFGFVDGLMVTIHAVTNDQKITDSSHSDLRRARAAMQSMIPTKTGAAAAVGLVLPALAGKLDGYAMRVPTINVSVVDLTFSTTQPTSVAEINAAMQSAAQSDALSGVLGYNQAPLVSIDFNHSAASSTFDATQTRAIGGLYKVVAWYDNEWGFSNRMLDTALAMMSA